MKDYKILQVMDRFKTVFEKLDIDYPIMRKILRIKLVMDARRVPTIMSNASKKKGKRSNEDKNNFTRSLWVYGLMGLLMVPFILMSESYIFQMSIVFGILIFMITTSLISDFSSVLLDITDKNIITSKPVANKTLSIAKTIHVFIYMSYITIALAGIPLVASLIRHGILFFIIFLLEIILVDLFIVMLTTLLYLIILKFFDGEKLKDIINYVQIALSISMTIGYQLIGRLFSFMDLNVIFHPKWWQYFIIPIWFGAPFEYFLKGNNNYFYLSFSILALVVPIISIVLYIKNISVFERSLQKLNNSSEHKKNKSKKFSQWLTNILCRSKEEKIFFRFASDMMRNERGFKLKVYPSLGFAIIFPFIFIFNQLKYSDLVTIASSKLYFNIYFCALLLPTIIMMIKYSGKHKGAWVYKILPIYEISPIFKGTIKALFVRLLLPVYGVECILFMSIFGIRIFGELIIVFLNIMLFTVLCFRIIKKSLPFSEAFDATRQSEGFVVFPLMLVIGVLGGIHFACTLFNYGLFILTAILILLNIIAWKKAFNISWENIV